MPDNKVPFTYTDDIKGYQNAVWDFLLEHSEPSHTGKLWIKFGTDGKKNFENRVLARWKYNYHREDVLAKAKIIKEQGQKFKEEKKAKKEKWRREKKERMALVGKHDGRPVTIDKHSLPGILLNLKKLFKK